MKLLSESTREKLFDTRVIEKNLNRGLISDSDVEKNLKGLSDDNEYCETVNMKDLADMTEEPRSSGKPLAELDPVS